MLVSRRVRSVCSWAHPQHQPLRRITLGNQAALGSLAVFVTMLSIFIAGNPAVFTSWALYSSVLATLPVALPSATRRLSHRQREISGDG